MAKSKIVHHDREKLAHYTLSQRLRDIAAVAAFGVFSYLGMLRIWSAVGSEGAWLLVTTTLLAALAADFVSGFVHWAGDTWGSVNMPVLGESFIRPFREHHVDEKAITRHDFFETNGNNCLVSLPLLMAVAFIPYGPGDMAMGIGAAFLLALTLWIFVTNQFHKWAHLDPADAPLYIRLLQNAHLILPPAHHAIHHKAPYAKYYNITNGWLNVPLYRIGFYPALERLITRMTGMLPRQDDIGVDAALELVKDAGIVEEPVPEPVRIP